MERQTGEKLVQELRGEVSNLLAAAQLLTPLVREQGSKKDLEYLAVMNQTLYHLLRTIAHLELSGERPPLCRKETLDLAGLCRELDRQVGPLAERMGVSFRCELECESLLTEADGMLMEQALLNLIANGMEAAGTGGHVTLRLSRKGEHAFLTVGDDGPGLREKELREDPLLKQPGGVGLGLFAARKIAALHGGALVLENREEKGVRAVLSLPLGIEESGLVKSPQMGYDRFGGFSTVLVELSRVLPRDAFLPDEVD